MEKLTALIDSEMKLIGGQKIMMPSLVPTSLWKRSGRWTDNSSKQDLFTVSQQELLLCPTHEEVVTSLVNCLQNMTFKSLPLYLYQVTNKFRNEKRPKSGLIRTREFLMKDLYTFDVDTEAAQVTYEAVTHSYQRIFKRLQLPFIRVEADPGGIGGLYSHEYHVLSDAGQDTLFVCPVCSHTVGQESHRQQDDNMENVNSQHEICQRCFNSSDKKEVKMKQRRGIEVGHTFLLGTRYTEHFDTRVTDANGKKVLMSMGCFGIGVTRLLATCLEVLSNAKGMKWPSLICPFDVAVVPPKDGSKEEAAIGKPHAFMTDFAHHLSKLGNVHPDSTPGLDVLFDDRTHMSIGKRDKDHEVKGIPFLVIAGKSVLEPIPRFEVLCTQDGNRLFLTHAEVLAFFDSHFKSGQNEW